jgi:hypothetical protein
MIDKLRNRPVFAAGIIVAIIAALVVAWWLISPLFISQRVDESFPMSARATLPPGMERAQAEATMVSAAGMNSAMDEDMPDAGVPVALKVGNFRDADSFHKGSGQATIYMLENGERVLRLENFQVTNGPDLHVYLAGHPDPLTSSDFHSQDIIDLGQLKGNIGSQNYTIPAGVDLSAFNSIVIYCVPFSVVFSVAPLQPT